MQPFISKRANQINHTELVTSVLKRTPSEAKLHMAKILSGDAKLQLDALLEIDKVHPKKLVPLFKKLTRSTNINTARTAIDFVGHYGTRKDLPLINRLMYSPIFDVRIHAMYVMAACNEPESLGYLQERLKRADVQTRKYCVKALSLLKPRDFELYSELSESASFRDPKRTIIRAGQVKDGSTTVLLGGKIYDKAIIRGGTHDIFLSNGKRQFVLDGIPKEAFMAWRKAFEHNWENEGLTHNPIEPILKKNGKYRAFENKDKTLRVSVKVIQGRSMLTFLRAFGKEAETDWRVVMEAKRQKAVIESTLKKLNITHSHLHPANFIIEMVEGKPRVYLVDFDAALIEKPTVA